MSENYIFSPINKNLFSVRSVYTLSFERLNKVDVRSTMNSMLEEQRSVIKFLLLEDEKPCHIFLIAYPFQLFITGLYRLVRTGQA